MRELLFVYSFYTGVPIWQGKNNTGLFAYSLAHLSVSFVLPALFVWLGRMALTLRICFQRIFGGGYKQQLDKSNTHTLA